VSAHEEETCPACRGCGMRTKYDACENCDGCGRIVTCLNGTANHRRCRGTMPAHEAETEGAYCSPCRRWLDVAAEAAQ